MESLLVDEWDPPWHRAHHGIFSLTTASTSDAIDLYFLTFRGNFMNTEQSKNRYSNKKPIRDLFLSEKDIE